MVLVLVVGAVAVLQHWNVPEYAITPGDATPVGPLVKIKGVATDQTSDRIMLTDVYLQTLTAWQWLTMHTESYVQFVPAGELVTPGIPADELDAQGFLEMSDSKEAAEIAAFRALGWSVPTTPSGAVINGVVASSPARRAGLHVADEVVGVDGAPVTSSCSLIDRLEPIRPGAQVRLSVRRAKISGAGAITWAAASTVSVTTSSAPSGEGTTGCAGAETPSRAWLGVLVENGVGATFPATVTINTRDIGGPSAGLAMTLALIDKMSAGSLTGHVAIAATGTIAPNGTVGDVGGVAEKTVAVQRAGAKVFFVPKVEVAAAESTAKAGLRIIGVTSLHQVLAQLVKLGGTAPVALTKPH